MSTPSPSFRIPPTAEGDSPGSVAPLWAIYLAGLIGGTAMVAAALVPALDETPALAVASVISFGAFAAVCTWLLNKINYFCKVLPRTKALAFLWGALAAAGFAVLANSAMHRHLAARGDGGDVFAFTPFTEEPAKSIGIVVVLLLAATRPRTALDGLVVGAFVGLGFEVVENVMQSINNAVAAYPAGQRDNLGSLATDVIHEIVRRSWTGHIVITGIAGFGIGYALTARNRSVPLRWSVAVALVAVALAGHMLWNSHRFGIFYVIGQFGLLLFFLWLIRVGRSMEAKVYLPYLDYADPTVRNGSRRATADLAVAIATGNREHAQRVIATMDTDRRTT